MSIKDQLSQALKEAMRAGDNVKKTTIRSALSAIKYGEVQGGGELDHATVLGIIQKEVKVRQEAIADAEKINRIDLIDRANAEIAVLENFLPKPLTQEQLIEIVKEAINETRAKSIQDMGSVMKIIVPKIKGRADGKEASDLVRKLLS